MPASHANRISNLQDQGEDALPWLDWVLHAVSIMFLVIASTALTGFGIEKSERLAWLPAYIAVAAAIVLRPAYLFELSSRNLLLLSWPMLGLISASWSLAPEATIYFSFQLLMTVLISLLILARLTLRQFLQFLFVSLLTIQLICVAFAAFRPDVGFGDFGELKGTFHHKNTFGALMAVQAMTAAALFIDRWRRPATATVTCLSIVLLLLSKSGAAVASVVLPLCLLGAIWIAIVARRVLDVVIGIGLLGTGALIGVVALADADLFAAILGGLGKDQTLTGRTLLWELALEAWENRPVLGFGFKGFWEGAPERVAYLRYLSGFDLWFFHNNYLEVLVAFGWVGLTMFVATLLAFIRLRLTALVTTLTGSAAWSLAILLFMIIYGLAENPLFENHSYYQILLAAAVIQRDRSVTPPPA